MVSAAKKPNAALNTAPSQRNTVTFAPSYYDSATTDGTRDYGSFGSSVFEDLHFTGAVRSMTIARLRREIRNNPYLAGIVNKYPEAVGFSSMRSRTSDKKYNEQKDLFWYRYSKRVTASGDSLRTVEEIILRELLIAGEVFFILQRSGQVQMVPSEFCGSPVDVLENKEMNGIVYNDSSKPVKYRFGRMTPFGSIDFSEGNSTLVDSKFVFHIYHKDRVLMGRGLPTLLPSLQTARDLYEITRAKTKQIKDVSRITGTITTDIQSNGNLGNFSLPNFDPETAREPTAEDGEAPADAQNTEPVKIELKENTFVGLAPGEKLDIIKSEYNASDYKELIMLMLHAIASPVGLPVELWFSGLGDVNYSGFKGLGTQWNGRRRYLLQLMEEKFLNRLQFWRISKAQNEGDLLANPDQDEDLIEWSWKRTAVLDDEKQAKSNKTRLEIGQSTVADLWEEDGLYAEEVFEKRKQLYFKALVASGELEEGADTSKIKVPMSFLLKNEISTKPNQGTEPVPVKSE